MVTIYTSPYFGKQAIALQKRSPVLAQDLIMNFTDYFKRLERYYKLEEKYDEIFWDDTIDDRSKLYAEIEEKQIDIKFYLKIFIEDNFGIKKFAK